MDYGRPAATTARYRGDALLFALLLLASLTLPWGLNASRWLPQGHRMVLPAIWAAVVGTLLGRSLLPMGLSWALGALLGAEYSIHFVGRVFPSGVLIWRDLRTLGTWGYDLLLRRSPAPIAPMERSVSYASGQLGIMIDNLTEWYLAIQAGLPSRDTTALRLGAAFIIWIVVMHAALVLFRRRQSFAALLPLGVGVISNAAYTNLGVGYVYLYLATALLMMVWAHVSQLETTWERFGIDYSSHLKSGAMASGTFLSAIIVVIALLMPIITYERAVSYFWDVYGAQFESFYSRLDDAFAGRNPVPSPTPRPRSLDEHLVIGPPRLRDLEIFTVRTSDPTPLTLPEYAYESDPYYAEQEAMRDVPRRYWRERTYDRYTGRGWDTSEQRRDEWPANVEWKELDEPSETLTQTFSISRESYAFSPAVNEPVVVDLPYAIISRGQGDLAALSVESTEYTVISEAPQVTIQDLQEAGELYPDWVRERYLDIDGVPQRVQELASVIVAETGAETPYEKAKAIEAYLRQYEYSLEVPVAPRDEDLVEWFLFDLRAGFCDHMAAAMVVMLRSAGVPTRYASGYSMGVYDDFRRVWVVRETNAHAWPEVYFPGYGWIEFEPTPAQAVFRRPARQEAVDLLLSPPPPLPSAAEPPREALEDPALPRYWYVTALLILGAAFLAMRRPGWFTRRRRQPDRQVLASYRGLLRQAGWLGISPRRGQTPTEYLRWLADEVSRQGRLPAERLEDISTIGRAYQKLRYSQSLPTLDEAQRVEMAYQRLRWPFYRLLAWRLVRPEGTS